MNTVAVVPSFQESEMIGETVRALKNIEALDYVLVVDDCSSDETAAAAAEAGASLVVNGKNMGKGGSLNRVLRSMEFDFLLLVDGDLGEYAGQAELLLEPVLEGEADLAIAAFPAPLRKGGFGIAQGTAKAGIRLLTGMEMKSPISGQRAMTAEVLDAVYPFDEGFGVEVGMTVDAAAKGFRVLEVETSMRHRETGRDLAGFIHRGRQFASIVRALQRRAPRSWRE